MIQIKVFTGTPSQCESAINKFLADDNIKLTDLIVDNFVDYYSYAPNQICNQWHETTIIYEVKKDDKCNWS